MDVRTVCPLESWDEVSCMLAGNIYLVSNSDWCSERGSSLRALSLLGQTPWAPQLSAVTPQTDLQHHTVTLCLAP